MRCLCCGDKFTPKYFLQKFCLLSPECIKAHTDSLTTLVKKVYKPVKPIQKLSGKRKAEMAKYLKLRLEFLPGKICPITKEAATEVHHQKGRIGKLLLDTKYWLAVSRKGHTKIENNPEWAYEMGYSLKRNQI